MEQLEKLVGSILDGRYCLHAVIGNGGSAVVFRGEDLLLRRFVAIKMLRSEAIAEDGIQEAVHATHEEARRINRHAFVRESLTAAIFSHPYVVRIYDVCPETDNPYIVMELVDGKPLSERIKSLGILPFHELLFITRCILEVLEIAHENGIVHRDIKAQNILLTNTGGVKVTDFGIAEINGRHSLSLAGKALGTADTMSPEQAGGERVDARSDLYSLGVLMYQMATGYLPFEGADPQTVAFLHRTEPPRYPSTLNPAIPRGLEQIILTAMEKEPQKRFSSATAMLAAIRRLEADPNHIFRRFSHRHDRYIKKIACRTAWLPFAAGCGVAGLLLLLFFSFFGMLVPHPIKVIDIPSYTNMQYESDIALGLDYRVDVQLRYVLRTDLPEGHILEQYPAAGTCWKLEEKGDRKTLWLVIVTHDSNMIIG